MPPSVSEPPSSSFDLLHERIRRWIWNEGWAELRDVQETAIRTILGGDGDAIITAATAAGKTEAAFLPICSTLIDDTAERRRPTGWPGIASNERSRSVPPPPPVGGTGVRALYIGPLKALINDQWRRLDGLCENLDIPVHRWHGDVTASARQKLLRDPDGILLITPESLEALFVRRGSNIAQIFGALRFIVIDELHAFIGSERGMQLQSLLHRLERVLHRRVRRIGLSATLGDMAIAADFLRPPNRRTAVPAIVKSNDGGTGAKLRLYGFKRPARPAEETGDRSDAPVASIADHLYRNLRGSNNLVFANARSRVEELTDRLARRCTEEKLPQEFFAHHGSLSRELRVDVEEQLKRGDRPLTVVCTSTLEMGIDIGAVKSVAQVDPPPNVAALRQRLGRSGRRGEPAILRIYIEEGAITDRSSLQDAIRADLVETIAMVNLMLEQWIEPPDAGLLHGSTLVQQILSLIAQYGGITAADAYTMLCESGPFERVTSAMFAGLLRSLAAHDLITQMSDGLLIHGVEGERRVNHYDFYTAFVTADEYRLVAGGTQLGSLPIFNPVAEGSFLIFAGRRWRVVGVDQDKRVIDLVPAGAGVVPIFDSRGGGETHDGVRREMLAIYTTDDIPQYLDKTAADLLREARENFLRYNLHRTNTIAHADGALHFPWTGTRAMNTLERQLAARAIVASIEGPALVAEQITPAALRDAVAACESERPVDTIALAADVKNKIEEKWDWALDEATLCASYASRTLERNPAAGMKSPAQ